MKQAGPKILLALMVLCAAGLMYHAATKPSLREGVSLSRAVYDRNGHLLRLTLSRDEKYRLWLGLRDISSQLIEATLLHEDRYFHYHCGINPVSLVRAVWHTYVKADRRMGGSTITMQLARIRYGIRSSTLRGKASQMMHALYLEAFYSKDEILEAYLNLVTYGLNIEGIGAASHIYFSKNAWDLTLAEVLTLSVIPQNPIKRIPPSGELQGPAGSSLVAARRSLFAQWGRRHPEDLDQRLFLDLPLTARSPRDLPYLAPHFVNDVLRIQLHDDQILTTLDLGHQRIVERQVQNFVDTVRHLGITNAAVLLVDHRTMEVLAMQGSAAFFDAGIQGQVNGTAARRSPGSAVKPFIYALAMDEGIIHPHTMLKDTAMSFGGYNPENFDSDFAGPLSAKDALVRSRNVPAVDLASRLSGGGFHAFLKKAGIGGLHDESYYGMTLALGSAEMTMKELITLYSMLARGGVLSPLRCELHQRTVQGPRLLSREASWLVLDMLAENPRPYQGYRPEWTGDTLAVSWKTGTSYGYRDAWAMGVFGPYVLGVWVGNFNGKGNPAFIGRDAAAPLFFRIVEDLRAEISSLRAWQASKRERLAVIRVQVCAVSGMTAGPLCGNTIASWFIPGRSPIAICDIHRDVLVDEATGLRACRPGTQGTRLAVYEFWPSDMLAIFRQAGIPRKVPPPFMPGCPMEDRAGQGVAPKITSPAKDVTYSLRTGSQADEKIPFTAVTDADAMEVYWFVDAKYVGTSDSGEPFFWSPVPGKFVVRAVDDHGRAASREITAELVR